MVLDENGIVVNHALVTSGAVSGYTDEFGIAYLKNVIVSTKNSVVTVKAAGYYNAYRSFPADNAQAFGKVMLERYQITGSVSAVSGGQVDVNTEVSINFQPGSFVNEDGSVYTGSVSVYASYLNPLDVNLYVRMPGILSGNDNGNVLLKTFGMLNVELKSDANLPLKLKSTSRATLSAAIPSSMSAGASATIPMWYFDVIKGEWVKDGEAIRQGNKFVAEVSHFTWWNYDYAYPSVLIYGTLKDAQGTPLSNTEIRLTVPGTDITMFGYSNQEGKFSMPAPLNSNCQLILNSLSCQFSFYTFSVTTGTVDKNAGTILVTPLNPRQFQLMGTFNNCANTPVSDGTVRIYFENHMFESPIVNGLADISFFYCKDSADVLIVAEDYATQKRTTSSRKIYANQAVNLGISNVCTTNNSGAYIRYIVDNQMRYITGNSTTDSLSAYYFTFTNNWIEIASNNFSIPGTVTSDFVFRANVFNNTYNPVTNLTIAEYPGLSPLGGNIEINNEFDFFGNLGDYVRGRAHGRIYDTNINQWRYVDIVYNVMRLL